MWREKQSSPLICAVELNYVLPTVHMVTSDTPQYLSVWASQVALVIKNPTSSARDLRDRFHLWIRKILWRRKWQLAPVFLPGEFHGQRSLAGDSPWGQKKLDTTEWLTHTHCCIQQPDPRGGGAENLNPYTILYWKSSGIRSILAWLLSSLIAVRLSARILASLNLSFLICKMKIIKLVNVCKREW